MEHGISRGSCSFTVLLAEAHVNNNRNILKEKQLQAAKARESDSDDPDRSGPPSKRSHRRDSKASSEQGEDGEPFVQPRTCRQKNIDRLQSKIDAFQGFLEKAKNPDRSRRATGPTAGGPTTGKGDQGGKGGRGKSSGARPKTGSQSTSSAKSAP